MASLTDNEKLLIARRAAGEYACMAQLRRIGLKSRNPEDAPYMEFLRAALKKTIKVEEYERCQRVMLRLHPEPFGPQRFGKPQADPEPKKRIYTCNICGVAGHNARGCPDKPTTPTVVCSDGLTRLSPGFDPSRQDRG